MGFHAYKSFCGRCVLTKHLSLSLSLSISISICVCVCVVYIGISTPYIFHLKYNSSSKFGYEVFMLAESVP